MMPLPSAQQWLTMGGDQRIALDSQGLNAYGCQPMPTPQLLAYGSVTASTISNAGLSAAEQLLERLPDLCAATYALQMQRIRREIIQLCQLDDIAQPDIIFAASGTDLHLFAAQLAAPSLILMIEGSETGGGIPLALSGSHFSTYTAMDKKIVRGEAIGTAKPELAVIQCRNTDGTPRPSASIDAEVEMLASKAVQAGQKVLLVITDVSKTGMIVPSPACAFSLKRRLADGIEMLVDACQMRLSPATLRNYLEHGASVAITGSKFLGGPAFSGALLVPQAVAQRWQKCTLPSALAAYSARADWPENWDADTLPDTANIGLLLRWEAALTSWRAFNALPEAGIRAFAEQFAAALYERLSNDTHLALLTTSNPEQPAQSWDAFPTIFPFVLRHADGTWLSKDETREIYLRLRNEGRQLGQPVACGVRSDVPVSALRLALSAGLIVEAISGRGRDAVIAEALSVLDRTAQLICELKVSS